MKVVIPVAGVGARLRPHTYALPKVLLNVAGKPILAHILDELINYGISDATIITGYMGDLIEDFITQKYKNLKVDFIEQKEMLGLGHAIWTGIDTYKKNEPLLITLGDTIFDVDLKQIFNSNTSSIGVKWVDDPHRFGVVIMDEENKKTVKRFVEKPETLISNLAIVGLYYIHNPNLLMYALNKLINNDIRTKNEYQLTDALQIMIDEGEVFKTFPVEGWYDCGKHETILSTNQHLLEKYPAQNDIPGSVIIPPVYISEDATIKNSIIGPYTSVAGGTIIKESIIKNSIISYKAIVKKSLLTDSIIGNEAEVYGKLNKMNIGNSSTLELE